VNTGESGAARGIASEVRMAPVQEAYPKRAINLPEGIRRFLCTPRAEALYLIHKKAA
jgi:hypothetical protein